MKKMPDEKCIAICGLFCGACPAFPEECNGCLSDFVREGCKECKKYGFRDCAKEHNVKHCYECGEFPCKRLEEFSKGPIINGICNHSNAIPDLESLKKIGKAEWIKKKIEEHTCKKCGELISWFDINSHKCK